MSGCAGSKHGIINDDIPLKKKQLGGGASKTRVGEDKPELKDLCLIIRSRLQGNKVSTAEKHETL